MLDDTTVAQEGEPLESPRAELQRDLRATQRAQDGLKFRQKSGRRRCEDEAKNQDGRQWCHRLLTPPVAFPPDAVGRSAKGTT